MEHMKYEFINKGSQKTIILLHGTGGNEKDLLKVGEMIDSGANLLGIRGNVLENGMPRYFRRLAEGIFDMEDLQFRTEELYNEIIYLSNKYQFNLKTTTALGYSNGANILANMLFVYPNFIKKSILFHPMVPNREVASSDLSETTIFISAGINDPICPKEESEELLQMFEERQANTILNWEPSGHQLIFDEISRAKVWYSKY